MENKEASNNTKKSIDFIEAHSLRELLYKVNIHNAEIPSRAILKEDIVQILKEEDTYIMIYYKRPSPVTA